MKIQRVKKCDPLVVAWCTFMTLVIIMVSCSGCASTERSVDLPTPAPEYAP
jgi:hypothetical protein